MTQTFVALTAENIKRGSIVRCIANKNWGTFRVTAQYDVNIWELGERVLMADEFKFWEIAA